jgi:tryptophan synthase alpha subunit
MGDLTLFLKAKGIILKDIPVQHLRQLAKSVSDANLPEYKVIIPTSTDRRTVHIFVPSLKYMYFYVPDTVTFVHLV